MTASRKYDATGPEAETQPGSRGRVLRNLRGIARVLSSLMALQAGLPLLDFNAIAGKRKAEYFAAIQAGMDRNYRPMTRIFGELIERSVAGT